MQLHATRIYWLAPALLLSACYSATGEPSAQSNEDPAPRSASNDMPRVPPAASGMGKDSARAPQAGTGTSPSVPPVPPPPVMPQPTTPPPVTTPDPPPDPSGLQGAECPSVFADPLPAAPARSDDGARGLASLRAELYDSLARWKQLSAASDGRYSYTQSDSSAFGGFCQTTVHVEDGAVSSRTQLSSDTGEPTETALWTELAGELDTHAGACHRAATLEQLYVQCSSDVLCKDPRENFIYLALDDAGVLKHCSYFPMGCADDCSVGVNLSALRLGDDAPECCPIEARPECCMEYGGADVEANLHGCGLVCDGMPLASAPWTRALDEYGCPRWVEPPTTALDDCCGCPPR